jgi:hypothetical protein
MWRPVHKGVVDRAVRAVGGEVSKGRCQERREGRGGHFTATHFEIAVLNLALAADVTVNDNVVRRVSNHQGCFGTAKQGAITTRLEIIEVTLAN